MFLFILHTVTMHGVRRTTKWRHVPKHDEPQELNVTLIFTVKGQGHSALK